MEKHQSTKAFWNHVDPEKEERLRWIKIGKQSTPKQPQSPQFYWRLWDTELMDRTMHFNARPSKHYHKRGYFGYTEWQLVRKIESRVKRILKLTKNINQGTKDPNPKRKSELVHLVEDFQKQYESLYTLYEDLRGEVKKKVNIGDFESSASTTDSESYFSPDELNSEDADSHAENPEGPDGNDRELEASDFEDTILKDKLTSTSEVKETIILGSEMAFRNFLQSGETLNDLGVEIDELDNTKQILLDSSVLLKGRLAERDELLSLVEELKGQVEKWKLENENLSAEKSQLEKKCKCKTNEAKQLEEKNSRMDAWALELDATVAKKENQFCDAREKYEKNKKDELGAVLSYESLMEQVNVLQHQVDGVRAEKAKLESELKMRPKETSERRSKIGNLNDLEHEVHPLRSQKIDLEEHIMSVNREAYQSRAEKEELQEKVSKLQRVLSDKENELSTQKMRLKDCQNTISSHQKKLDALQTEKDQLQLELKNEKKRLQMELEKEISQKERWIIELNGRVSDQQRIQIELEDVVRKLKDENKKVNKKFADSKTNFQTVERKVEEIVEEVRKQFEDNLRILSRRIRVAEQLHMENKDSFRKKKEMIEQENKDITHTAKDMLNTLDTVTLKFEECNKNFLNRISKASCELKFAKEWAMRKNKALAHVRDDLDCLLAQLDDKEDEILASRERLWKAENKVREVEKIMKEKEEGMVILQEEKKEAIRQLCVWIDYHRSLSDYYKKILSEITPTHRK